VQKYTSKTLQDLSAGSMASYFLIKRTNSIFKKNKREIPLPEGGRVRKKMKKGATNKVPLHGFGIETSMLYSCGQAI
jgi:hypothetical protein